METIITMQETFSFDILGAILVLDEGGNATVEPPSPTPALYKYAQTISSGDEPPYNIG